MNKEGVIFSVDIETGGPYFLSNEIISIGYYVCDHNGNEFLKKRVSMTFDWNNFDSKCVQNFWYSGDNFIKLMQFQREQIHPKFALIQFLNDFKYYMENYSLVLVTDNPVFDIPFINFYIEKFIGVEDYNYLQFFGGNFYQIHSVKDYLSGLCKDMVLPITNKNKSLKYYCKLLKIDISDLKNDHYPENDAEYIAQIYHRAINSFF